jgi:hypothetical protein
LEYRPRIVDGCDLGRTMRLGAYDATLTRGSRRGANLRRRGNFRAPSPSSSTKTIAEFIGVQFHPELFPDGRKSFHLTTMGQCEFSITTMGDREAASSALDSG